MTKNLNPIQNQGKKIFSSKSVDQHKKRNLTPYLNN